MKYEPLSYEESRRVHYLIHAGKLQGHAAEEAIGRLVATIEDLRAQLEEERHKNAIWAAKEEIEKAQLAYDRALGDHYYTRATRECVDAAARALSSAHQKLRELEGKKT